MEDNMQETPQEPNAEPPKDTGPSKEALSIAEAMVRDQSGLDGYGSTDTQYQSSFAVNDDDPVAERVRAKGEDPTAAPDDATGDDADVTSDRVLASIAANVLGFSEEYVQQLADKGLLAQTVQEITSRYRAPSGGSEPEEGNVEAAPVEEPALQLPEIPDLSEDDADDPIREAFSAVKAHMEAYRKQMEESQKIAREAQAQILHQQQVRVFDRLVADKGDPEAFGEGPSELMDAKSEQAQNRDKLWTEIQKVAGKLHAAGEEIVPEDLFDIAMKRLRLPASSGQNRRKAGQARPTRTVAPATQSKADMNMTALDVAKQMSAHANGLI